MNHFGHAWPQPPDMIESIYNFYGTLSHVKISPRGEIFSFNPGWKKFQPGSKRIFFTSIHAEVKIYLQRLAAFFTNILNEKSPFCMQLWVYIKTMLLDFITNRSKMFNFKTFKVVLLATIDLVIARMLRNFLIFLVIVT